MKFGSYMGYSLIELELDGKVPYKIKKIIIFNLNEQLNLIGVLNKEIDSSNTSLFRYIHSFIKDNRIVSRSADSIVIPTLNYWFSIVSKPSIPYTSVFPLDQHIFKEYEGLSISSRIEKLRKDFTCAVSQE